VRLPSQDQFESRRTTSTAPRLYTVRHTNFDGVRAPIPSDRRDWTQASLSTWRCDASGAAGKLPTVPSDRTEDAARSTRPTSVRATFS